MPEYTFQGILLIVICFTQFGERVPTLRNIRFCSQATSLFAQWETRPANHVNTNKKAGQITFAQNTSSFPLSFPALFEWNF